MLLLSVILIGLVLCSPWAREVAWRARCAVLGCDMAPGNVSLSELGIFRYCRRCGACEPVS